MAVSKRTRYEVLRRDNHTCRYCGSGATDGAKLTVDHVVPVALGGGDDPANLVAACRDCNAGKSSVHPDSPLVDNVADDALRWSAAMRWAAEAQEEQQGRKDAFVAAFDDHWSRWKYDDGSTVTRPADWASQVGRWADGGVSLQMLRTLIDEVVPTRVADDRMWPYFYGAVKNKLRQQADMAREYLDRTEGS